MIDLTSRSIRYATALAILVSVPYAASPPAAGESLDSIGVGDLGWLAGDWVGREGDSYIQEQWSVPQGKDMMGMFRLIQAGEVVFYEFMTLTRDASGTQLRIKHFDPGLVGWEEKADSVVFRLVEAGDQRAVFETEKDGNPERLVFERSQNELVITLVKPAEDVRTPFRYQRQDP